MTTPTVSTEPNVAFFDLARYIQDYAEQPGRPSHLSVYLSKLADKMVSLGVPFSGVYSFDDFDKAERDVIKLMLKEKQKATVH